MHIMEGFLPGPWWQIWWIIAIPFIVIGFYQFRNLVRNSREMLPLLGVAGAFIFILSALKLPSVTGSCSHPTGTGFSAIVLGPFITCVIGFIVLIYQAIFLAHGGITTLGANTCSMAIFGPVAGYAVYRFMNHVRINFFVDVFIATVIADLFTYVVTSLQLALAFPSTAGGLFASFAAFLGIFALTQVPLAIVEGIIITLTFKYLIQLKPELLVRMGITSEETMKKLQEAVAA